MTADDAFDARLAAAFQAAEPPPDAAFTQRVTGRLAGADRRRVLIIGGAGVAGATIAASQLGTLYRHVTVPEGLAARLGEGAGLLVYLQPETLAAVTLAVMATAFAFILPSRS